MRIVLIIILTLAVFCSCVQKESPETNPAQPATEPTESVTEPTQEQPKEVPAIERESPFAYVLDASFDRSAGIKIPNFGLEGEPVAFDFGEPPFEQYPSGAWSIDELEGKFGKSEREITGSFYAGRDIFISISWDELVIFLRDERNGVMSFDVDSSDRYSNYPLNNQDKRIKVPVFEIWVYGKDMPLPRGLFMKQSTVEDVKAAYPVEVTEILGSPGPGAHSITYKYIDFNSIATKQEIVADDIGYVSYSFENGKIAMVEIGWGSTKNRCE